LAHKAIVQYTADKKEYVRHNMHGMCWQLSLMGYNHCCVPSGTLLHNAFVDPTVVFSTQQHSSTGTFIIPHKQTLQSKPSSIPQHPKRNKK
jgi:hypothetical protein